MVHRLKINLYRSINIHNRNADVKTDDLHTMRTRRTASHLAYIMLCAFAANTGLYYYIKKKMEEPNDEEPKSKEVVSAMHSWVWVGNDDVEMTENAN